MSDYKVTFARSARKDLERLSHRIADRILEKSTALEKVPRPAAALKLKGESNLWRLRVGDYRVIYDIDDSKRIVDVTAIRHRREVYRDV